MKQTTSCPGCGPTPAIHRVEYYAALLDTIMTKIFPTADRVMATVNTILRPVHLEKLTPLFLKSLATIGLGQILTAPVEDDSWRTKCLWEAAEKKGITMWEFRFFKRYKDLFVASLPGKTIVFDGLPRPEGRMYGSLNWMDNKGIMNRKFSAAGIPVARGQACFTKKCALETFKKIDGSAIAKPHIGSRSRHTTIHLVNEKELLVAFTLAKQLSPWAIVEEELNGMVFRATVIGGKTIAVMRREPPHVIGDGHSTVTKLMEKENQNPMRQGPIFHHLPQDEETERELERQSLNLESVPDKRRLVTLSQKVGRGSGASTSDVTHLVHPANNKLFEKVAEVLDDPLVGIDFIIADITKPWFEQKKCGVIECNSLPFIDLHHYPLYGKPRDVAGALWDFILKTEEKLTV